MSTRWRTFFQLVRLPNLFTAPPDVLAGAFCAGVALEGVSGAEAGLLAMLGLASMHFYAGGVVLNDVFDARRDALERPDRPIPSGAISPAAAARLFVLLILAGLTLAFAASNRAGVVALLLVGCMVLYDGALKRTPAAPWLMGACRSLNLLTGASAFTATFSAREIVAASTLGGYVALLTLLARDETKPGRNRVRRLCLIAMWIVLVTGFLWMGRLGPAPDGLGAPVIVVTTVVGIVALNALFRRDWRELSPDVLRMLIPALIALIVAIDACVVWIFGGWVYGLLTMLFLIPFLIPLIWYEAT